MKVILYKDITTENIMTLSEVKAEYAKANDCELPIDNETMESIIYENLALVGGNIEIIDNNDEILAWCNDYAEYMEADRYMTEEEIKDGTKENYLAILNNDAPMVEQIYNNLFNEDELSKRLEKLLGI